MWAVAAHAPSVPTLRHLWAGWRHRLLLHCGSCTHFVAVPNVGASWRLASGRGLRGSWAVGGTCGGPGPLGCDGLVPMAKPGRTIFWLRHDHDHGLRVGLGGAAGLQRCEGGCGPGEAAEWRWGCPADVAYGLDRSPRKERSKKSMQAGAAAAGPIFQRVTHRNRQVNVLVVVASAALAAAVYDAALATYLAASLAAAFASAALPAEIVAAT